MPGFDVTIGSYTLVPNPFWGGVLFPLVVFAFLVPLAEHRAALHPATTATTTCATGRAMPRCGRRSGSRCSPGSRSSSSRAAIDRVTVLFDLSYTSMIWFFRVAIWVLPVVVGFIAYRVCIELQHGEEVERTRKAAGAPREGDVGDHRGHLMLTVLQQKLAEAHGSRDRRRAR